MNEAALREMSDGRLRSLIGQAYAILRTRERERSQAFREIVRQLDQRGGWPAMKRSA